MEPGYPRGTRTHFRQCAGSFHDNSDIICLSHPHSPVNIELSFLKAA